jgi:hypothetical protein
MTTNTTPRYILLGSVGANAYAIKHKIAPIQRRISKGVVNS